MLTDAQKKLRLTGIGGSDAAAICGLSDYSTPLDIWRKKMGYQEEEPENEAMYWGNVLEPIVANEFVRITGKAIKKPVDTYRHTSHHFMVGNLDYLLTDEEAVLECKTASIYTLDQWGESWTSEYPKQYVIQCAHYAAIMNVPKVYLAVLFGNNTFRVYLYERDMRLEENLIKAESKFWNEYVVKGQEPPPKNIKDIFNSNQLLSSEQEITATTDIMQDIVKYKEIQAKQKVLEQQLSDEKFKILRKMGTSRKIVDEKGEWLIKLNKVPQKRLDTKQIKEVYPDICKSFEKTIETNTFLVRTPKGDL